MESLVQKLETTTVDDLELRCEIATQLGWKCELVGRSFGWHPPNDSQYVLALPPRWLTSLDAAITLVPKGWYIADLTQSDRYGRCHVTLRHSLQQFRQTDGSGYDIAQALCAAALRAQGVH